MSLRKLRLLFVYVCTLALPALAGPHTAGAQEAISFGSTTIENNFPDGLTFKVTVSSNAGDIVGAELVTTLASQLSSRSRTPNQVEFEPGEQVELSYTWDTDEITVPPSTPVLYYWRVSDSAGNRVQTAEEFVSYDDVRFDWRVLENEEISIWWHDKPDSFGQGVFAAAVRAVAEQRELFGSELAYPIQVVIYNNDAEFQEWHGVALDWVGGEAFADYGITAQIFSAFGSEQTFNNIVIPHEISHLYFAQVTRNPRARIPHWLNEGTAQYNQFGDPASEIDYLSRVAADGNLVPLSSLAAGFGVHNEERVRLAYDEALSAVVYIIEEYGQTGLTELLHAYGKGLDTDAAFQQAFGREMGQFEREWAVWLGAAEGSMVTATPWPMPTFPPSPTPQVIAQSEGGTPRPTATERATEEALQAVTASKATVPPPTIDAAESDPGRSSPIEEEEKSSTPGAFSCLSMPMLLIAGIGLTLRRSKLRIFSSK